MNEIYGLISIDSETKELIDQYNKLIYSRSQVPADLKKAIYHKLPFTEQDSRYNIIQYQTRIKMRDSDLMIPILGRHDKSNKGVKYMFDDMPFTIYGFIHSEKQSDICDLFLQLTKDLYIQTKDGCDNKLNPENIVYLKYGDNFLYCIEETKYLNRIWIKEDGIIKSPRKMSCITYIGAYDASIDKAVCDRTGYDAEDYKMLYQIFGRGSKT